MRLRRQGADLDEAETHVEQRPEDASALVEARGHAHRISECQPPQLLREAGIVRTWSAGINAELEGANGEVMRALGIERVKENLPQAIERVHGKTPAGNRWLPSSRSGKASIQSTRARLRGA